MSIDHNSARLSVLTEKGILLFFELQPPDFSICKEVTRLKVTNKILKELSIVRIKENTLVIAHGEPFIHLWNIQQGCGRTIRPCADNSTKLDDNVRIIKVTYDEKNRILAAGMDNNCIAFWCVKEHDNADGGSDSLTFDSLPLLVCEDSSSGIAPLGRVKESIKFLQWDANGSTLLVVSQCQLKGKESSDDDIVPKCSVLLFDRHPCCSFVSNNERAVVQTGPKSLSLLTLTSTCSQDFGSSSLSSLSVKIPSRHTLADFCDIEGMKAHHSTTIDSLPAQRHEQTANQIRALFCSANHLACWDGQQVFVYQCDCDDKVAIKISFQFECEYQLVAMTGHSLITGQYYHIQVHSYSGVITQLINLSELDGQLLLASQCVDRLAVYTSEQNVKIWQITTNTATSATGESLKPTASPKSFADLLTQSLSSRLIADNTNSRTSLWRREQNREPGIRVNSLGVNCNGARVALTIDLSRSGYLFNLRWPRRDGIVDQGRDCDLPPSSPWLTDSRLYVYAVDSEQIFWYDFVNHISPVLGEGRESMSAVNALACPYKHYWDQHDDRLIAVEVHVVPFSSNFATKHLDESRYTSGGSCGSASSKTSFNLTTNPRVYSLFVNSQQNRLVVQENFELIENRQELIGLQVPYFYLAGRPKLESSKAHRVNRSHPTHMSLAGKMPSHGGQDDDDSSSDVGDDLLTSFACSTVGDQLMLMTVADTTQGGLKELETSSSTATVPTGDETTVAIDSNQVKSTSAAPGYIDRRVLRDFVGLENIDPGTRRAVLEFSYCLTLGQLESAVKAMKLVKNPAVWQKIAQLCIETRNIELARRCLGKLGLASSAWLLREKATSDKCDQDVLAGHLALLLGMTEDAKRLFILGNRWDLVVNMNQTLGQWKEALETASLHCRILVKPTHHAWARELELDGHIDEAIDHYVKADAHRTEVTRLLKHDTDRLVEFIDMMRDPKLYQWWAKELEKKAAAGGDNVCDNNRLDQALDYYRLANDIPSLVRLLCRLNRMDEAENLCASGERQLEESSMTRACLQLAECLEEVGQIDKAITMYMRVNAYQEAMQLSKLHNRLDHVYTLAQLASSSSDDALEAANFLLAADHTVNQSNWLGKAITLLAKAGHYAKALQLALDNELAEAVQEIAKSLLLATSKDNEEEDNRFKVTPSGLLVKRCADFFIQRGQVVKAVELLAAGSQYKEAIELCDDLNLPLTQDLVDKLTPSDNANTDGQSNNVDHQLLLKLAHLCLGQGQYYLACKKFTQSGNRIEAMKALIRSGNTDKILFFANVSRQKELWAMAGNYLQTLDDWRSNPDRMRSIVQCYTRAKAFDLLASFYEACAQAEVDESGNYDQAVGALTEAYKSLLKSTAGTDANASRCSSAKVVKIKQRLEQLDKRLKVYEEFTRLKLMLPVNTSEALLGLRRLLDSPEACSSPSTTMLRPGDLFACMVDYFVAKGQFEAAASCLEEMAERVNGSDSVTRYVKQSTLQLLQQATGLDIGSSSRDCQPRPPTSSSSISGDHLVDELSCHDDYAPAQTTSDEELNGRESD